MINKLIEKYKRHKQGSEDGIATLKMCSDGKANVEIDEALIESFEEFIQDLEEIKKHQLEILNQTKKYLNSQKATQEMIAMAIRKIEISILGVDIDE